MISQYRQISDVNLKNFDTALKEPRIQNILNEHSVEVAFTLFDKEFSLFYEKHIPVQTKTLNHKNALKPWINDTLKRCMKIRNKLCKLVVRNIVSPEAFKRFCNLLTYQLRKAKEIRDKLFKLIARNIVSPETFKRFHNSR